MIKTGRRMIMIKIERVEDNDVDEWKDSDGDGEEGIMMKMERKGGAGEGG